ANNLHQLGLAMHNYHDQTGSFPAGATGTWTVGWAALVLPYVEQLNAYNLLDRQQLTYVPNPQTLSNRDQFANLVFPIYVCPSSSVPPMIVPEDATGQFAVNILAGHYVGIMGASTSPTDYHDPTGGPRIADWTPAQQIRCNFGGFAAANGGLYPGTKTRILDIPDGTTPTILLGEQSDWGKDPGVCPGASPNPHLDIRMAKRAGIWTGASTNRPPMDGQGASESASLITVRYP